MRAIILSDIHLGWEQSQDQAFRRFIRNLPNIDYLILNGDIFEFWRRDMVGVMIEHRDVLDLLAWLRNRGTNVIMIYGNHDEHLVNMGPPEKYPEPFRWREEYRIKVGARTYIFKHGHQFDATCAHDEVNERVCHTNDAQGQRMSDIGDGKITAERFDFANPVRAARQPGHPFIPLGLSGIYQHVARPGLSDDDMNLTVVRRRARASIQPNEFLVHGHTHVPLLEENYADTGTWTGGRSDYIEINDLDVQLKSWSLQ